MFKVFIALSLFIGEGLFASSIVASVNNVDITQDEINEFLSTQLPGSNFSLLTEDQKKTVVSQLIDSKLFLEDAKKMKIDKNRDFIEELKKEKEKLMLAFWMKKKVEEIVIANREAKVYYRDNLKKFNQPASVKVRHILLSTEGEAKDIIRELTKHDNNLKENFIALAKDKSTGPSSVNGGELDWFIKEQMVPEFSESAFSLNKGEITHYPVKTQFGYHVIYLEDRHDAGAIPFDVVKSDIIKVLRRLKFKKKLAKLSKKMKKTAKISVK